MNCVTYERAYVGGNITLCDACVEMGATNGYVLGQVQHGRHTASCEGARHITADQIEERQREAEAMGWDDVAEICGRALGGDEAAREELARLGPDQGVQAVRSGVHG